MDKFFYNAHQYIQNKKALFGVLALLLFGGLLWVSFQIKFEEDISKLIPANDENKTLQKVLRTVNFSDKIIVNIRADAEGSSEDLIEYASEFVDSVEKNSTNYIINIQGKVADDAVLETIDFVYENVPLFLSEEDYTILKEKINKDSIAKITQGNYRTLVSPSGMIAKSTILKDPLGISFLGLQNLQQLGIGENFKLKDGFLITKDEKNILLFITPVFGSGDTSENEIFTNQLKELQNQLNSKYSNKVESDYFGAAFIAVANAQQIKKDIKFTMAIALSVLILIFIFFYRKLTIPLILFVPTIFGGLLSIAFLYFLRTEISVISLGIGSVLLGVTLDYSLHILTHIRNNETIFSLFKDVTKPVLMSSLTTALAFLCLLFLDSQALQDLGIFAAISVLGASVFALLFIPQVYKGEAAKKTKTTFLDRIAAYDFQKNKILIGGICVFLVVSVFTYNKVIFNNDISQLNYEPEEIINAQNRLNEVTDVASKSVYVSTYGNSLEEVLQANDAVYDKLQQLQKNNQINSFNSAAALVSSEEKQFKKIEKWNRFWQTETIQQTKEALIKSGDSLGFKPTTFHQFYELLQKDFKPLSLEDYKSTNVIPTEDYIASKNNFITITSLVKLEDENSTPLRESFKNTPNTLLIDRQQMNESLLGNLKTDFNHLIWYCLGAVLLLLLLFYKSIRLLVVTSVPIFLTWMLTIGMMGIFKIEFNIFNIIISTFIFGLGIDYSIFMTNGLLKEYKTGTKTLATHKTSIILSVITTILGVGVLIFAKHPALYSISVVSIIGIFSAMIIAFTIQPVLFKLLITKKVSETK